MSRGKSGCRTSATVSAPPSNGHDWTVTLSPLSLWSAYEAAGIDRSTQRRGSAVACSTRAGAHAAGRRVGQFFRSRLGRAEFFGRLLSRFRTWAGPTTASRSIFASAPAIATTTENSQQNSQRSLRMLCSRQPLNRLRWCSRLHPRCPSCLWR